MATPVGTLGGQSIFQDEQGTYYLPNSQGGQTTFGGGLPSNAVLFGGPNTSTAGAFNADANGLPTGSGGVQGPTVSHNANPNGPPPLNLGYKSTAGGIQTVKSATPAVQSITLDAHGNYYDANGKVLSNTHADAARQAGASISYSASLPTSIGSTVNPPSAQGTPTLPNANAPSVADQFNTSLAATLQAQQNQLAQSLQSQQQSYQTKIDALQKQSEQAQHMQELGLASEKSVVGRETQEKQAALEEEQAQFQKNYDARQKLVDQLGTLLTTGQQVIEQMKGTTGLSSIMSPRISQTMADVQGQAGVITATLSAMSDQIGLAQNQLSSSLNAITSIYHDQLAYWDNVISFYNDQEKVADAKASSLSKDQQVYVNAQIQMLHDNISNTQKTTDLISKAFLDPQTALVYSTAGVSLTDSPAQIGQKLATYEAVQVIAKASKTATTSGTSSSAPAASTANAKGRMASKQYVELSLQRAGLTYQDALGRVPQGKVGVIDNATGQIGFIDPTEYNTKQYTYL
jgi:hypothetical protein